MVEISNSDFLCLAEKLPLALSLARKSPHLDTNTANALRLLFLLHRKIARRRAKAKG